MKIIFYVLTMIMILGIAQVSHGQSGRSKWDLAEDPDEGPGAKDPSSREVQRIVRDYITGNTQKTKTKTFNLYDVVDRINRRMQFVMLVRGVHKTGEMYYSRADFRDVDNNQLLDLDFYVGYKKGKLMVLNVRIHSVAGKVRYTYDRTGKRMPIYDEEGKRIRPKRNTTPGWFD